MEYNEEDIRVYYVLDLETNTFDTVQGYNKAKLESERIENEQWDMYGVVIAVPVRRVKK